MVIGVYSLIVNRQVQLALYHFVDRNDNLSIRWDGSNRFDIFSIQMIVHFFSNKLKKSQETTTKQDQKWDKQLSKIERSQDWLGVNSFVIVIQQALACAGVLACAFPVDVKSVSNVPQWPAIFKFKNVI